MIFIITFNNVTNNISTIANTTFKKFSRLAKYTSDAERFTSPLQSLKNDESIITTKSDKGRGVVILNKDDYHQKVLNILTDHTKFKKITTEMSTHLLYLEDKLKRPLRTIKSSIDASTYNFLSTSGSKPGLLYGLPKVHKPNIPLRPIISSIGTFNYNTAKFLVPIISPLTTNQYTIENSTAFANEITSLNPEQPITMASFDVESLFTNVPLLETTEIIVNNINSTHLNIFNIPKDSFRKLLHTASHHSVFSYDNDLYTQTGGVAMGSPLGPSYANAFLCYHEHDWLIQYPPEFKPIYYRRYIDTFVKFKHPSHVNLFLVTNDNGRFHTSIYRKPTFTDLDLHFLSNIPYIYKINSIKTLITRAYNLCSNWSSFHDEMNFLKNIFCKKRLSTVFI
ncbi:uncharacterized protein [Penaeus vannamei]|uniref:uncharacterized protein n=1 Tax=Penaeus vannamei TaxID=6689 RepID=UPI00387FA6CC